MCSRNGFDHFSSSHPVVLGVNLKLTLYKTWRFSQTPPFAYRGVPSCSTMKGDPVVTGGRIASLGLFLEAVPLVGEFHDDPLVLKPTACLFDQNSSFSLEKWPRMAPGYLVFRVLTHPQVAGEQVDTMCGHYNIYIYIHSKCTSTLLLYTVNVHTMIYHISHPSTFGAKCTRRRAADPEEGFQHATPNALTWHG